MAQPRLQTLGFVSLVAPMLIDARRIVCTPSNPFNHDNSCHGSFWIRLKAREEPCTIRL